VTPPDLDALAPDWEALAERVGATPFLRPGWFAAWERAFAPGRLELLTAKSGDRLAAVLPFVRAGETLRSPTNEHSHDFGLLAEEEECAAELARKLFAAGARRVSLHQLDSSRADFPLCREAAETEGYRVVTRPLYYNLFVRLPGDLPSRLARDVERRRRRLEEQGTVSVEVDEGIDRLEEGLSLEGSGWKAAEQTAILSSPATADFYREIAEWAAARGWLRLCFLRVDGRAIAFQFALEQGGAHYFVKGGYDPDYNAFSPGKLLLHATLMRAREQGLARYELLGDVEPWKLEWGRNMRLRLSFDAFSRSLRGFAGYAARAHVRPLLHPDRRRRLLTE
jgi:CelD/BcsL family acetyltransferase involved in cellulose biosynthesis